MNVYILEIDIQAEEAFMVALSLTEKQLTKEQQRKVWRLIEDAKRVLAQNRPKEALRLFNDAGDILPDEAEILSGKADCLACLRAFDAAENIARYGFALYGRPVFARILSKVFYLSKDYRQAIYFASKYYDATGTKAAADYRLKALFSARNLEEAEKRALDFQRDFPGADALLWLAKIKMAQGKLEEAEDYARELAGMTPGSMSAEILCEILRKQGRHQEVVGFIEGLEDKTYKVLLCAAYSYKCLRQYKKAFSFFSQAEAALKEENPHSVFNLRLRLECGWLFLSAVMQENNESVFWSLQQRCQKAYQWLQKTDPGRLGKYQQKDFYHAVEVGATMFAKK